MQALATMIMAKMPALYGILSTVVQMMPLYRADLDLLLFKRDTLMSRASHML